MCYELIHLEDCTKTFLKQRITTKSFAKKIAKKDFSKINVCITNENQNRFMELCLSEGIPAKKVQCIQVDDHLTNSSDLFVPLLPLVNNDNKKVTDSHHKKFLVISPGSLPRLKRFIKDFKRFLMNIKCDVSDTSVILQYSCKKHLSVLHETFYSIRNIQFIHQEDTYQMSFHYDFVINASGSSINPELFFPEKTTIQTCCGSNSMLPSDGSQTIKRCKIHELKDFMITHWGNYKTRFSKS